MDKKRIFKEIKTVNYFQFMCIHSFVTFTRYGWWWQEVNNDWANLNEICQFKKRMFCGASTLFTNFVSFGTTLLKFIVKSRCMVHYCEIKQKPIFLEKSLFNPKHILQYHQTMSCNSQPRECIFTLFLNYIHSKKCIKEAQFQSLDWPAAYILYIPPCIH